MKQYRTLLFIVTFLFIGWTFLIVESCAQVKLTQVESDTVLYRIPVAHRTIPGQSGKYFMKYMGLEPLMDSLDLKGTKIDSMTFASDTLKLYTNDGIFKVEILSGSTGTVTSVGLTTGTSGTDVNVTGSPITSSGSFTLNLPSASASNRGLLTSADHTLFSNKFTLPSLSSGSVIFSNGGDLAQDYANFYWNNSTKRLSLGTTTASRQLTTTQDISVNGSDIGLGGGNQPNNCRFGNAALRDNTTGVGNLAFGAYTMMNNTTGYYNSALGNQALFTNVSGHTNTAIGQNTLYYNTGSKNTGIGTQSLFNNIGGEENTGIGPFSLYSNVSGSRNIAIGYLAGYSETGSDKLYIDPSTTSTPLIGGNFSTNRVGINKAISSLSTTLHVGGDVTIDTRTGTGTSLAMYDSNGKLCTAGLTGLTISGGNLVGAAPLSGTTGAIPYFTSTTALGSTPFTYNSNIMTIPTGNSIYFPGTATIIDKNASGGSAGEFLSRAASGGGMDWVAAPSLSEVDGSITNEGILGVSAGSGTTAVITSNTSGATGVTLSAGSNITISESTSTNGGTITIAGSFSEVDGSITNEGYQGVTAGSGTSSVIQGYNSAGTATGTGTTINAAGSISISETASVNGGQITLDGDYGAFSVAATTGGSGLVGPLDGDPFLTFTAGSGMTITRSGTTGDNQTLTFASTGGTTNLSYSTKSGTDVTLESSTGADVIFRDGVGTFVNRVSANVIKYDVDEIYGQLNNTAIIGSATIDGVYRSVDFTVEDESFASIINAKTASDEIEVLVSGTYEIHYSLSYLVPSSRDVRWRIYRNTADIGYIGELTTYFTAGYPSKTFNIDLTAGDDISLRYIGVNGVSGTIDINSPILKVKRIK